MPRKRDVMVRAAGEMKRSARTMKKIAGICILRARFFRSGVTDAGDFYCMGAWAFLEWTVVWMGLVVGLRLGFW